MQKFSWRQAGQNTLSLLLVSTLGLGLVAVVQGLKPMDGVAQIDLVSTQQDVYVYRANQAAMDALEHQTCVVSREKVQDDVWEVHWSNKNVCPNIGEVL